MFPGDDIKNTFNSTGEIRVIVESMMDHIQKFHVGFVDTRYSVISGLCWMILRAELELMLLGSGTAFDTNKSLATASATVVSNHF